MFERNYFVVHDCLLSCRCVIFQKQYFEQTKMGGHKQTLGAGMAPPPPVAMALMYLQFSKLAQLLLQLMFLP